MRRLRTILPHVCIVLSLMFLVFLVLDDYNPMMDFLTNPVSKALLAALCAASVAVSVLMVSTGRKAGNPRGGGSQARGHCFAAIPAFKRRKPAQ